MAKDAAIDKRWLAIGVTYLQIAFMAMNRSVFKPTRISLPTDAKPDDGSTAAPAVSQH